MGRDREVSQSSWSPPRPHAEQGLSPGWTLSSHDKVPSIAPSRRPEHVFYPQPDNHSAPQNRNAPPALGSSCCWPWAFPVPDHPA